VKDIPVYVMPRMKDYIANNSMFSQLILNKNIILHPINNNKEIVISESISVKPFEVPHRNELSETVGFKICRDDNSIIYLPDIDSWDEFKNQLFDIVTKNEVLFLDGTFFSKDEIKNRDVTKIPHPEILETMSLLSSLSASDKKKVHFIHFNHTNGILSDKNLYNKVVNSGFLISEEGQRFNL